MAETVNGKSTHVPAINRMEITQSGTKPAQKKAIEQDEELVFKACRLIVDGDPEMSEAFKETRSLARRNPQATIVFVGETGTGKDLFAQAHHLMSGAKNKGPFLRFNCGGVQANLLDSDLFGHEKGSFTGAAGRRYGRFEEVSEGGTLFLDEIGDMPPAGQARLLHALELRTTTPVGGNQEVKILGNIVCATNVGLDTAVAAKRFREDLRYRMTEIFLPPYRQRAETHKHNILDHLLLQLQQKYARPAESQDSPQPLESLTLEPAARDYVLGHPLPGNVRQLSHGLQAALFAAMDEDERNPRITMAHVQRAIPLAEEEDDEFPIDLGNGITGRYEKERIVASMPFPPREGGLATIATAMKELFIARAMEAANGVQSKAAEMLGISRNALRDSLSKDIDIH